MTGAASPEEQDDGDLYDAYLDAALSGRTEDPAVFLARHPGAGPELRARLLGLGRILGGEAAAEPAADPADAPALVAAEGLPWESLGGFRLIRPLHEGGMGSVYVAQDPSLGRLVALKVIRSELRSSTTAAARLQREASALARLDHPNIVKIHASGEEGGVAFLVMALVPGIGLDEALSDARKERDPPPVERVVRWGAALADALACAHAADIVHRDVKPSNVLLRPDGRPVLIDFGIARTDDGADLTRSGPFLGSPLYASPEQVREGGSRVDARTDVYALGALLYECLTLKTVVEQGPPEVVFRRILDDEPVPLRRLRPEVPRDLETIIRVALDKDPARRYPDARAFADDLLSLQRFLPIHARPPGRVRSAMKWIRRHPIASSVAATALLAALGGSALAVAAGRADRQRDREDASALVQRAAQRVTEYRARSVAAADVARAVRHLREDLQDQYLPPERIAELDDGELALEAYRRDRETVFVEVLATLGRARRLDAEVAGIDDVSASLFAEKFREAQAAGEDGAARYFRRLVLETQPEGPLADVVAGRGVVFFDCDTPDARVELLRFEEQSQLPGGGGRRLVPVACAEQPTTLGIDPDHPVALEAGDYLAVFEADGRSHRTRVRVSPGKDLHVKGFLNGQDVGPPGFVLVRDKLLDDIAPFWIGRHEITVAEYLAFLDDPATQAEIDAATTLIRVPRDRSNAASGGFCPRGPDGRYRLPEDWRPEWPVFSVSFDDAAAYARWRGAGYAIPMKDEWIAAARHTVRCDYVFGHVFRPAWTSSCFATPEPGPSPVGSHPVDESVLGVRDMAGSVAEWVSTWWDDQQVRRHVMGGTWATGEPTRFRIWGMEPARTDAASTQIGFRLIFRPQEDSR